MTNRESLIRLNHAVAANSMKWAKTVYFASLKDAGNYYEYLHRWRVILLLGLIIGGLAGFGFPFQPAKQVFQAQGTLKWLQSPGPTNIEFTVLSGTSKDPESAVLELLTIEQELNISTIPEFAIRQIIVMGQFPESLWKNIALGSVIGWLLVIGAVYVGEDVLHISGKGQQPPRV